MACAHGHVVGGFVATVGADFVFFGRDEQFGHEVNDVAAGKVRAGFLVVTFGKLADKLLEDVAHVHRRDFVGRHVRLLGVKLLYHDVQHVAFDHVFDFVGKLEVCENILDIVGKTLQVVLEVAFDVVGIGKQACEVEFADVVEGVTRSTTQRTITDFACTAALTQFFVDSPHLFASGGKGVVETL